MQEYKDTQISFGVHKRHDTWTRNQEKCKTDHCAREYRTLDAKTHVGICIWRDILSVHTPL
jgi:hypothetical protein